MKIIFNTIKITLIAMMCFTIGLIIAEINTPVDCIEDLILQQIELNSYSTQVVVYAVGIGIIYVAEIIYGKIVQLGEQFEAIKEAE